MNCTVNGKPQKLPDNISVEELITHLNMTHLICAVEVDKQLVPNRQRASCQLKEAQHIEIVTLIGGG